MNYESTIETSPEIYQVIPYDEVWLLRNSVKDSLQCRYQTIQELLTLRSRGYAVDGILNSGISDYFELLRVATQRLASPTFNRREIIRWVQPNVIA
jgi:hypothetical protein